MTWKRILPLLVLLLALGAIWSWQSNRPRLTVLIYGKPPQGASIVSGRDLTPLSFDQHGNVVIPASTQTPNLVMVKTADGKDWTIRYPQRGHETLDLRGRYATSETESIDLGFYRHRTESEVFTLTDEEMDRIQRGEVSPEETQRQIRAQEDQKTLNN